MGGAIKAPTGKFDDISVKNFPKWFKSNRGYLGNTASNGEGMYGQVEYIRLGHKRGILNITGGVEVPNTEIFDYITIAKINSLMKSTYSGNSDIPQFKVPTIARNTGCWYSMTGYTMSSYGGNCVIQSDGQVQVGRWYQKMTFGGWGTNTLKGQTLALVNIYVEEV